MKAATERMSLTQVSERECVLPPPPLLTSGIDDESRDCEEVKLTSGSRFGAGSPWSVR